MLVNIDAPCRSSVRNKITKERQQLHVGFNSRNFAWAASVWNKCRVKQGISMSDPIAVLAEEDETPITMARLLDPKTDRIVGVCGKHRQVVGERTKHFCDFRHVRKLGNLPESDDYAEVETGDEPQDAWRILNAAFDEDGVGNYARIILLQPMVAGFPPVVVFVQCVCNRCVFMCPPPPPLLFRDAVGSAHFL